MVWHWTPSTVWPVAAFSSVASFGPLGTGTVSGPGVPAGGCTHDDDMEAGMGSSAMCGFLAEGGGLLLEPPVTTTMRITTSAITTTAPPMRMPRRIRFARCSAARLWAALRWFSALRWAFDLL